MTRRLIALRFSMLFGSMKGKNGKKSSNARLVWTIIGISLLLLYFLVLSGFFAFGAARSLRMADAEWLYFPMFLFIGLALLLFLSTFETKSILFESKDNDLLLSMPVRPQDIVRSRAFTVLIYNYLLSAIVLLPAVLVYPFVTGDLPGAFGGLVCWLLMPPFATAVSSFFGFLLAKITARVRHKNVVGLILSVTFFVLYFWGYTSLMSGISGDPGDTGDGSDDLDLSPLISAFGFARSFGEGTLLRSALPFLLYAVLMLGVTYLAYRILSAHYVSIVTVTPKTERTVYRERRLEQRSVLRALTKKEFMRFTSSSAYMMNGGSGYLMMLILSVFAAIRLSGAFSAVTDPEALGFLSAALGPMVAAFMTLMLSLSGMTPSVLSLEGKSFWIPKTMPVKTSTVLLSKTLPQALLGSAFSLICSVILIIALPFGVLDAVFLLLLPQIGSWLFAFYGLLCNLLLPKFDFDNEVRAIKQSGAVTLSVLSSVVFSMLFFGGVYLASLFFLPRLLVYLLMFLVLALLTLLCGLLLFTSGVRRYDSLTA